MPQTIGKERVIKIAGERDRDKKREIVGHENSRER